MTKTTSTTPLWQPDEARRNAARITTFRHAMERKYGVKLPDYEALLAWSVTDRDAFWSEVWDMGGVIAEAKGPTLGSDRDAMPGAEWFPDARLNFAENLLRRNDDGVAIVFRGERGARRTVTFASLREKSAAFAGWLAAEGVEPTDRVAAFMPNLPETVIAMLGAATLGAVWSSCSPDFGVEGVIDRFGQIEPKILIAAEGYSYNGKTIDCLPRITEIVKQLPSVERVVLVPFQDPDRTLPDDPRFVAFDSTLAARPRSHFEPFPFDHPLYILFSSGTTGVPKCIVHGAGGTLLQHLKEHQLHCDIRRDDRVFYFTTCGWMMWNWLVTALASEATLVLFDGSPFHPTKNALWDLAQAERVTLFGTSAKYLDACKKADVHPLATHDLTSLRTICSTGSPLAPDGFVYVYEKIKRDVQLASISGGTDIVSCFVLGNPAGPVYPGECQVRGLGMDVHVFNDERRSIVSDQGDLVCTSPFPSMPIAFWNDPTGERYQSAYFELFPGAWCHGDWVELTPHGGMIIYGRSDATLNPGGVRIGTAEIYRQVEAMDEVIEALAIGQEWDDDTRIVLFVRLAEGVTLDDALTKKIQQKIRENTSPRHVPAVVLEVKDLPRTKSGKIAELAVRNVVHGREVKNTEALANPEALAQYANRPELR